MKTTAKHLKKIIKMIMRTQEKEISCDDVHDLLGQYTEMALDGQDVANLLPFVHHHLLMCPDCKEEYEALTRILENKDT